MSQHSSWHARVEEILLGWQASNNGNTEAIPTQLTELLTALQNNTAILQQITTMQQNPTGTTSTTYQIDNDDGGPILKNVNGGLQVRNATDTGYADIRVGNVVVTGTSTVIESNVVEIGDAIITLNRDYVGADPTENAGLQVNRGGTLPDAFLLWDELNGQWVLGIGDQLFPILYGTIDSTAIENNSITSEKIVDGTIQPEDLAPGPDDTVLQTDSDGNVEWAKVPTLAIAPGANETILTTDATGTVVWGPPPTSTPAAGTITAESLTLGATSWFGLSPRLTGDYSDFRRMSMARLLDRMTTKGLLQTADVLYLAGQNEADTLLNWVKDRWNGTKVGSPTFVSDRGYTGIAGNANWIRITNYTPNALVGGKVSRNSMSVSVYSRTAEINSTVASVLSGGPGFDYTQIDIGASGGTTWGGRVNSTGTISANLTDTLGTFTITRTGASDIALYKRGDLAFARNDVPSTALTSGELSFIGDGYSSGFPANLPVICVAQGWTAQNCADFDEIIQEYLDSFGAGV